MPRNVRFSIESIREGYAGIPTLARSYSAARMIPALGSIELPPPGRPSGESMLTIVGFCFLTYERISSSENNEHVSTEQFVRTATPVALSPAVRSIPITLDPSGMLWGG